VEFRPLASVRPPMKARAIVVMSNRYLELIRCKIFIGHSNVPVDFIMKLLTTLAFAKTV